MSVQSDIHQFLASVAKGANGRDFVPMDPGNVARQLGINRNHVNKTIFNLTQAGKIELERGPNGRQIVGFKLLAEPQERKPRAVSKPGRQRLASPVTIQPGRRYRGIPTPALDEYAAGKEKFIRLRDELGDLVEAEFRTNPYAEEGLMLKERLAGVEEHYGDLARQHEEMSRDLRALRGRAQRELAESVAKSGSANGHE